MFGVKKAVIWMDKESVLNTYSKEMCCCFLFRKCCFVCLLPLLPFRLLLTVEVNTMNSDQTAPLEEI